MDTINVDLPAALKEFIQTRVAEGGYSSVSAYVRDLIHADQKQRALAVLETEVLKGINSGPSLPMTAEDWSKLRARIGAGTDETK